MALFFGSEPWHFYGTAALPMLTLSLLPFTLHGSYYILKSFENTAALEAVLVTCDLGRIF